MSFLKHSQHCLNAFEYSEHQAPISQGRHDPRGRTGAAGSDGATGQAGAGGLDGPCWATQSSMSSVPYRSVERPQTSGTALGSGSSLNSPYTYYYGTAPLNPARRALVHRAFRKMDRDGSGVVDWSDLKEVSGERR